MGNTEAELLKVLGKLERTLAQSSTSVNSGDTGNRAKIAGGRSDAKKKDKGDVETQRSYRAVAASLDAINSSTKALNQSFKKLEETVKRTYTSLDVMEGQIRAMGAVTKRKGTAHESETKHVTDKTKYTPLQKEPVHKDTGGKKYVPGAKKPAAGGGSKPPKNKNGGIAGLGGFASKLTDMGSVLGRTIGVIGAIAPDLKAMFKEVVEDIFSGAARGIDTSSVLGLYDDAIRAGMGMREYSKMLSENMPSVARHGSFEEFSKTLDNSRERLSSLGVFGEEATKASAAMATTATMLGVSQRNMDSAAAAQTSVFAQLRTATLMTVDEFRSLSEEIGSTQEVQSEMLGLNQDERIARMGQLMSMRTLGEQMGATKAASKALGDALIQQRNLTASQRFKSAGTIRQAGAITGMNSTDTERLAQLSRKKNLSKEEGEEATRLGSQMQASLERMMNSGNISQEHIAERLQEELNSSGIGKLLTAAGNVSLPGDSGEIANKELGKGASELVKGAGMLLTYAEGLSKSPLAGLVGVLGTLAAVLMGGKMMKAVGSTVVSAIASKGGKGGTGGKAAEGTAKVVPKGGKLGKLAGLAGLATMFTGGSADVKSEGVPAASESMMSALMNSIGGIGKFLKTSSTTSEAATDAATEAAKVAKTTATSGKGKASQGIMQGVGKVASMAGEAGSGILKSIGGASKALMGAARAVPFAGTIATVVLGAVGEAFTGEARKLFDPSSEGGIPSFIGNMIFSGFNSLFGGIAGILDSGIKLITGFDSNLENAWEKLFVSMRATVMGGIASMIKALPFGEDSAIGKYFQSAADSANEVLEKLSADQTATIATLSAGTRKIEETQKKTNAAINETGASIATGTANITQSVIQDAKRIAAVREAAKTSPVTATPVKEPETVKIAAPAPVPEKPLIRPLAESEQKPVSNTSKPNANNTVTENNVTNNKNTANGGTTLAEGTQIVGLLQRLVTLFEENRQTNADIANALSSLSGGARNRHGPEMTELFSRMVNQA